MGLLDLFIPGVSSNPFYKAFDQNRGKITGAFGGMVGAGNDPRQALMGFTGGLQHGVGVDQENAIIRQKQAEQQAAIEQQKRQQEQVIQYLQQKAQPVQQPSQPLLTPGANAAPGVPNQTVAMVQQKAASDPRYSMLLQGVQSGAISAADAFTQMLEIEKPQDPYTLGENQTRFAADGTPIARGMAKTPDTLISNNIGGSDKFYDTLDAKLAEQNAALIDAGLNAQSNNIRLSEISNRLASAPQGITGAFAQIAGGLGIPVEGLDDLQAAQALINQLVPGQRVPGSGTMSDADLALFKASLPAIINQPGGNKKIIETAQAINAYTIEQASIAQQVANREISPAEGRKRAAAVPNPLAGLSSQGVSAGAKTIDGVTYFPDGQGGWYTN